VVHAKDIFMCKNSNIVEKYYYLKPWAKSSIIDIVGGKRKLMEKSCCDCPFVID